jgi:hypothetical protein
MFRLCGQMGPLCQAVCSAAPWTLAVPTKRSVFDTHVPTRRQLNVACFSQLTDALGLAPSGAHIPEGATPEEHKKIAALHNWLKSLGLTDWDLQRDHMPALQPQLLQRGLPQLQASAVWQRPQPRLHLFLRPTAQYRQRSGPLTAPAALPFRSFARSSLGLPLLLASSRRPGCGCWRPRVMCCSCHQGSNAAAQVAAFAHCNASRPAGRWLAARRSTTGA